jgi:anti-sigma-K factor RskA
MTESRHIAQEDLALYAMQALSADESMRVREHLGVCPECREELARVSGDLALVAMSVEASPLPEGARQRFLARIGAAGEALASEPLAPARTKAEIEPPNRGLRWAVAIPWAAVAALILISVALGVRVQSLNQRLEQQTDLVNRQKEENERAQAVLDLLTAPEAQHVTLTATESHPAPTARTVYLAAKGALLMQASNLNAVPAGKTYELWVIPVKGAPLPAGLFRPDGAGNAEVVLPELPKGVPAKAFGVTIEKAGGSSTPTAPILLEGAAAQQGE